MDDAAATARTPLPEELPSPGSGWGVALGGMTAVAVTFGLARYGYGLFLPQLRAEFGLSAEQAGVIASVGYASYLVALLASGALAPRWGPRPLVLLGTAAAAAGTGLVAAAPDAGVLAAGVCLGATGAGWCWAPFSDAVARQVPVAHRNRALAVISTGTTVGVLVSAPAAVLLGEGSAWRAAWLLFAVLALGSLLLNAVVLEGGTGGTRARPDPTDGSWRWVRRAGSAPLFVAAAGYGLSGTVYWTFAVDRVVGSGTLPDAAAAVFWLVVGGSGLLGMVAGHLVDRCGLRAVLVGAFAALAAASALLALRPSWLLLLASAALFGAGFMTTSAVLVIWSGRVFPERPASGFTAALGALALGAIGGPALLGAYAERAGLAAMFGLTAALTVPLLLLRPRREPAPDATTPGALR